MRLGSQLALPVEQAKGRVAASGLSRQVTSTLCRDAVSPGVSCDMLSLIQKSVVGLAGVLLDR